MGVQREQLRSRSGVLGVEPNHCGAHHTSASFHSGAHHTEHYASSHTGSHHTVTEAPSSTTAAPTDAPTTPAPATVAPGLECGECTACLADNGVCYQETSTFCNLYPQYKWCGSLGRPNLRR